MAEPSTPSSVLASPPSASRRVRERR